MTLSNLIHVNLDLLDF